MTSPADIIDRATIAALEGEGWVIVPAVPTETMVRAGVDFDLSSSLGGGYRWPDKSRDHYRAMLAARPR